MYRSASTPRVGAGGSLLTVILIVACCCVLEYLISSVAPQQRLGKADKGPETFSVKNTRKHLDDLVAFGPRPTGSYVNEIAVPSFIRNTVLDIYKSEKGSPLLSVEVDTQHPSSHFYLDFLGGITNVRIGRIYLVPAEVTSSALLMNFCRYNCQVGFLSLLIV